MAGRALTEQEIDKAMARADGALGAAGHVVTDPRARAIIRSKIAGEITVQEAEEQLIALYADSPTDTEVSR